MTKTKMTGIHRTMVLSFCLSFLLNIVIYTQVNATQIPDAPANSPNASARTVDASPSNKFTSASEPAARPINPSRITDKLALSADATPTASNIGPMSPRLDLEINPSAMKMEGPALTEPEIDSEGAPRNFAATAYNLRGRTASGLYVRRGVIAADPRVLPLGSVVQVKAGQYSGIYTVHDTGHRIKGHIVDIWMPSSHEARRFGRRPVKLQVIRYGPRRHQSKR